MTEPAATDPDRMRARRAAILTLGIAAAFVALAIAAAVAVAPWFALLAFTVIPNVVAGVRLLRTPTPTTPAATGESDTGDA
jgi:hypothetical protein